MKLAEIIEAARAADPSAFGSTGDKRAVRILRASLRQVGKQLKSTNEGNLVISGLGRFAIKNVERKRGEITVTKRRVIFRQGGAGKKRRPGARKAKRDES